MARITAVIVCRNERVFLDLAIRSAQEFVEEVIVGDMGSNDGSAELARSLGARVVEIEPAPVVELVRPMLVERASSEWILLLDPDEVVSPSLGNEVVRLIDSGDYDALDLPFATYIMGRSMVGTGWSTEVERHLRVFRRGAVSMPAVVHAPIRALEPGRAHRVEPAAGLVHHFNYVSWEQFVDKMNRYTTAEAKTRATSVGQASGPSSLTREVLVETYWRGLRERAWRDGWRGAALVALMGVYRGLVYVKTRQLRELGDESDVIARYRATADDLLAHRDG